MRASLAGAALGLAALGACASGPAPQSRNVPEAPRVILSADALVFASFDANSDLRIDQAELTAGIEAAWRAADASGDGVLQPLEFSSWQNAALGGNQTPPYRLDFDRNVDNAISGEEFRTELAARAGDYDSNDDGVLVRSEFLRPLAQARLLREGAPGETPVLDQVRRRRAPGG